jgi:hypothetical protein
VFIPILKVKGIGQQIKHKKPLHRSGSSWDEKILFVEGKGVATRNRGTGPRKAD